MHLSTTLRSFLNIFISLHHANVRGTRIDDFNGDLAVTIRDLNDNTDLEARNFMEMDDVVLEARDPDYFEMPETYWTLTIWAWRLEIRSITFIRIPIPLNRVKLKQRQLGLATEYDTCDIISDLSTRDLLDELYTRRGVRVGGARPVGNAGRWPTDADPSFVTPKVSP
ncbi:hypothetical protein FA15DRAFT_755341 [Coprinopsis marcescibilis]|nr:hypothetical protein FA15DRAFT_755341 [Coprinopsis marcescibilis]